MIAVHILISLLPVVFFLAGLVLIDSYKLVRPRAVALALLAGCLSAILVYFLNAWLWDMLEMNRNDFSRYVAPLTEEGLKAIWIIYLVFSDRVGFTVDAAIMGFAVGAGFAVVENMYYLSSLDASTQVWIIRGFGTAIMHGASSTILAIILKTLQGEHRLSAVISVTVSMMLAYAFHSTYNHFPFPPMVSTAILILVSPLLVSVLFQQSEKRTRSWLGTGFDTDQELMDLLMRGDFSASRIGTYLTSLKEHFEGPIVADMLCLIRTRVELSIRAKGVLMMREAGFEPRPDELVKAKFDELQYLEDSIGKTGLMAVEPIHKWSREDLWQLTLLSDIGN